MAVQADAVARRAAFEIETQRLLLRPLRRSDVAVIAELAADVGVASMTARIPHPYTLAHAEAFVAEALEAGADGANPLFGPLGIERRPDGVMPDGLASDPASSDGVVLGCIGLTQRPAAVAEIGYWVGRPYWGQGYATEAARALIDHAFASGEVGAVEGSTRVINDASRRVLERCGLRYVNSGLASAPARGGALPVDYFRLGRRDWDSLKAWRPASVRTLRQHDHGRDCLRQGGHRRDDHAVPPQAEMAVPRAGRRPAEFA